MSHMPIYTIWMMYNMYETDPEFDRRQFIQTIWSTNLHFYRFVMMSNNELTFGPHAHSSFLFMAVLPKFSYNTLRRCIKVQFFYCHPWLQTTSSYDSLTYLRSDKTGNSPSDRLLPVWCIWLSSRHFITHSAKLSIGWLWPNIALGGN